MSFWKAVVLAVVQGLTEFLPVSSSAHLAIAERLLGGIENRGLAFEVVVHLGTLAAVLWYFRKDLFCLIGWGEDSPYQGRQMKVLLFVLLASLPTGVIGVALKETVEKNFSNLALVGALLLVTAGLLYAASRMTASAKGIDAMRWWQALLIGTAQGLAIFPGISRSGATVATGLFTGLERQLAFRFSFLLFVPAMLGATALELPHISESLFASAENLLNYGAAFIVSGLTGYAALGLFAKIMRQLRLQYMAYYCAFASGLALALHFFL